MSRCRSRVSGVCADQECMLNVTLQESGKGVCADQEYVLSVMLQCINRTQVSGVCADLGISACSPASAAEHFTFVMHPESTMSTGSCPPPPPLPSPKTITSVHVSIIVLCVPRSRTTRPARPASPSPRTRAGSCFARLPHPPPHLPFPHPQSRYISTCISEPVWPSGKALGW